MIDPTNTQMAAKQRRLAFLWLVRSEFWEHRWLYLLPLASVIAGVGAFAYWMFIGEVDKDKAAFSARLMLPSGLYFAVLLPAVSYASDALLAERRDRSIMFWKSLPASDRMSVLSKAAVLMITLVPIKLTAMLVGDLAILGITAIAPPNPSALASTAWGLPPMLAWWLGAALQTCLGALWHAPLFAWLLLVSAMVQRAPLLWASVPLLAIPGLERLATGESFFAQWLYQTFLLPRDNAIFRMRPGSSQTDPGHYFASLRQAAADLLAQPQLWIGLAVAAAFIAGAIHVRKRQGPI